MIFNEGNQYNFECEFELNAYAKCNSQDFDIDMI